MHTQQSEPHQQTPNVDPDDIARFEQDAHAWWDTQGPFKPLHIINPVRLNWVKSFINLDQASGLDIGCGGGIFTASATKQGADMTGIDMSETAIGVAKAHATEHELNVHYHCTNAETWRASHAEHYDFVSCFEVLEHVPDPAALVAECLAMVKPKGHVFFSTLNRTPLSFLQAIIGGEYLLGLIPKGTHTYEQFITPAELSAWIRAQQAKVLDVQGLAYHLFPEHRAKLSANTLVNFVLACQKN